MEKKNRYCPSCGTKTNDRTCDICGRKTKPISERYHEKNLYILEDDVATDDEFQQYHQEQQKKARDTKQREQAFDKESRHPQFEHPEFEKPLFEHPRMKFERQRPKRDGHIYQSQGKQGASTSVGKIIALIIVIGVIVCCLIGLFNYQMVQSYFEESTSLSNYEILSDQAEYYDTTGTSIHCNVENVNGTDYIHISSDAGYATEGNVSPDYFAVVLPKQDLYMVQDTYDIACPLIADQEVRLFVPLPNVDYRLRTFTDANGTRITGVLLQETIDKLEMNRILNYLMAYGIFESYANSEEVVFYVEDGKKAIQKAILNFDEEVYTYYTSDGSEEETIAFIVEE